MRASTAALLCAVASVVCFAYLLAASNAFQNDEELLGGRRLLATRDTVVGYMSGQRRVLHWTYWHTVALVLSVVVSLTSSLDRECGASLYVVLFAVLLDMSFRKAAALTAFTVALGALAPGIASMSEARLTERGVLPMADYPGALVLLPTMFWGVSFGAIVNLWFPNWLLALMWVLAMLGSNLELLFSFMRYLRVKHEAADITARLRMMSPPPSSGAGTACGTAASATSGTVSGTPGGAATTIAGTGGSELTPGGGTGDSKSPLTGGAGLRQRDSSAGGAMSRGEVMRERADLMERAQRLAKQAHKIEARALLYPTLYVPDVGKALQKANIDPTPCGLRATATPSCVGAMDYEQERLIAEQKSYQQVFGRFAFSWKKWWHLNRHHFELGLVLKVVVLHLVTEAVRHHTSKPCSDRFWVMLIGMTGLVTCMLMFSVTCYGRRRLWRGPHWVDALNQVRAIKKEEQARELEQLQQLAGKDAAATSPTAAAAAEVPAQQEISGKDIPSKISAASAAVASGDAVAMDVLSSNGGSCADAAAAVVPDAAAAAAAAAQQEKQHQDEEQLKAGCWAWFKSRLPWVWVTGPEAITNICYCNSRNQYQNWQVPLILLCAAATLPVGIFGCALGLPGGPIMAHMLLALGLKPEVVAGTSRFLVLCFTFGSFVAHNIAGGLEPTLAAAFGLLNLGLAPLGMFLITKFQPRGQFVIGLSLFMGMTGLVVVTVWQLVPLMAAMAYAGKTGDHWHAPLQIGYGQGIESSLLSMGNTFDLNRFCHKHH